LALFASWFVTQVKPDCEIGGSGMRRRFIKTNDLRKQLERSMSSFGA